jgi:hypothetical protein
MPLLLCRGLLNPQLIPEARGWGSAQPFSHCPRPDSVATSNT